MPGVDIDPNTPDDVCVRDLPDQGEELVLVWSDEFAGDRVSYAAAAGDPRWTAVDLYYGATADKARRVMCVGGVLVCCARSSSCQRFASQTLALLTARCLLTGLPPTRRRCTSPRR